MKRQIRFRENPSKFTITPRAHHLFFTQKLFRASLPACPEWSELSLRSFRFSSPNVGLGGGRNSNMGLLSKFKWTRSKRIPIQLAKPIKGLIRTPLQVLFSFKWILVSLNRSGGLFFVCASRRRRHDDDDDDACPGSYIWGWWLRPIFGGRHVLFIIRHFVTYSVAGLDRDID